jgi:hypothetical protein
LTTPTYTKEEWDSRRLTYSGALCALLDIMLMGLYLIGGIAFVRASSIETNYLMWGYLAVGIFLMFNAIGKFMCLVHPRDWYETEITIKKGEGSE